MTNLADCLQAAMDGKMLSAERGRAAQERYGEHFRTFIGRGYSEADAHVAAADATISETLAKAKSKRHASLRQLDIIRRNEARYAMAHAKDPDLVLKDLELAEKEKRAIEKSLLGGIGDFLKGFKTNIIGQVQGRALLKEVLRELHGEASGNAAAQAIAQAVLKAFERARTLANANGMDIAKLADFGVPHMHNARKIAAAGFRAWSDMVYDRADWSRIVNHQTGKPFAVARGARPFREDVDDFLEKIYENIITGGWNDRSPSMAPGGRALYASRSDPRILHFKSADDWMVYNDAFGMQNPFEAVVSHIRGMASDIALMRAFGPNPKAGLEHAIQVMERDAARAEGPKAPRALEKIQKKGRKARVMLSLLNGSANVPHDSFWAAFFAGTRNLLTAAQLGSAGLSSITDLASMAMASRALKLGARGPLQETLKNILGGMDQQTAKDLGFILDTWFDTGSSAARFMGDVWSPELTSRVTNFVLRANGLSFWTDRARVAVEAAFGSDLAQLAGKSFDDLNVELKTYMQNRGIGAREWDAVRAAGVIYTDARGGRHINANWFREHTDLPAAEAEDIAIRWGALVQDHMEQSIPTSSIRGRASIIGESRPGSLMGELARSGIMYKGYALSQMFNMIRRLGEMPGNLGTKARFATFYVAAMTAMGALSLQLKEIAKGNDVRSMNPLTGSGFWRAALLQGGGIGIFGDFFSASTSRTGAGIQEVLLGPVVGLGSDVLRATTGQLGNAWDGGKTSVGRSLVNLGRRYNPLASFQPLLPVPTRAALDRMVWDQLQWLVDPEADMQFRRVAARLKKEKGTQMWWNRGQMLPSRLPAIGGAP